jgi:hypothetical protein
MTDSEVPTITDLSEGDRKLALQQVEHMLHMLGQCECYLRDYGAGTQNVAKLFGMMCYTEESLISVRDELAKLNPTAIPQGLRRSDEAPWGGPNP